MIKNERGSTLLVVMLMITVFTVLGLSILSSSISGSKRTEIREEQVTDDLEAIRDLNEAVAFIKKTVEEEYNPDMLTNQFNDMITIDIIQNGDEKYGYQIKNISKEYAVSVDDFTRILEITSSSSSSNYKQKVYITGMPSFLKYAVGSRGTLTLNGSTYIEKGNIYANEKLILSNEARYIFNGENLQQPTKFPSVSNLEENLLFIENANIEYCNSNCYDGKEKKKFPSLSLNKLNDGFDPYAPTYSKESSEFVEVDIEKTFIEKLQVAGISNNGSDPKEIINNWKSNPIEVTPFLNLYPASNGYVYDSINGDIIYIDPININLPGKPKWLVIDGDAVIENIGTEILNISSNILITGDLTIRGKIAFDSTIYVLGDTTINNVNITGLNDGELILMTQGQLEIARINKFTNEQINSIKAYLYTNKDAEVYAVGSYLYVEGGIFAQGDLEINAYRGTAMDRGASIEFDDSGTDETDSRLIIKNNKRLFLNQSQGLPKIDKLEVLTDLMEKK